MNRSLCFEDKKTTRKLIPSKKRESAAQNLFSFSVSQMAHLCTGTVVCFSNRFEICQNMLTQHENIHTDMHMYILKQDVSPYTYTYIYINRLYTHEYIV